LLAKRTIDPLPRQEDGNFALIYTLGWVESLTGLGDAPRISARFPFTEKRSLNFLVSSAASPCRNQAACITNPRLRSVCLHFHSHNILTCRVVYCANDITFIRLETPRDRTVALSPRPSASTALPAIETSDRPCEDARMPKQRIIQFSAETLSSARHYPYRSSPSKAQ
jgi:hypothetical protein